MSDPDALAEISGKRAHVALGGALLTGYFGRTTFSLLSDRLVVVSTAILQESRIEISVDSITACRLCARGSWLLLGMGLLLLPVFGIGLLFLLWYLLSRIRFLVVSSEGNTCALRFKGEDSSYQEFATMLVRHGVATRSYRAESVPGTFSRVPAIGKQVVRALGQNPETMVTCSGCNTNYSLPLDSKGQLFRCQCCRMVVEVE